MAERRTTRRRPQDDDRLQDEDRLQDDDLAEEYDDELPEEADGLASDDVDAADEAGETDEAADDAGQDNGAVRRPPTRRKSRRASGTRQASGSRRAELTAAQAAQMGLQQLAELVAKPLEGVTQVQPDGDTWTVGVEVVEDRRVPSSADVLALYEIDIDKSGDVLSYRRLRRYARGRGDGEGA